MAKSIIMQVMTALGYEPMYPFNPSMILNATVESTSTATNYNLTITPLPTPLTQELGNQMGIICFIPNVNNANNVTITLNGGDALPVTYPNGSIISGGILIAGIPVFVKYYNNRFNLIIDKNQIGLNNVDNTSDLNKPISNATQAALDNKLNTPQRVPENSNLNNYITAGFYYNSSNAEALTMANLPEQRAFSLLVERQAGVKQTFTTYDNIFNKEGVRSWVRTYYDYAGVWGAWTQEAYILYGVGDPPSDRGLDGNIYIKYQ